MKRNVAIILSILITVCTSGCAGELNPSDSSKKDDTQISIESSVSSETSEASSISRDEEIEDETYSSSEEIQTEEISSQLEEIDIEPLTEAEKLKKRYNLLSFSDFEYGAQYALLQSTDENDGFYAYAIINADGEVCHIIKAKILYDSLIYTKDCISIILNSNDDVISMINFDNNGELSSKYELKKHISDDEKNSIETVGDGYLVVKNEKSGFDYSEITYSLIDTNGNEMYSMSGEGVCFWLGSATIDVDKIKYWEDGEYYIDLSIEDIKDCKNTCEKLLSCYYFGNYESDEAFIYDVSDNKKYTYIEFEEYINESAEEEKNSYFIYNSSKLSESDNIIIYKDDGEYLIYDKRSDSIKPIGEIFEKLENRSIEKASSGFGVNCVSVYGDDNELYWFFFDDDFNIIKNIEKIPGEGDLYDLMILNENKIYAENYKHYIYDFNLGTISDIDKNVSLRGPFYNGWAKCNIRGDESNINNFINEEGKYLYETVTDKDEKMNDYIYADDSVIMNK